MSIDKADAPLPAVMTKINCLHFTISFCMLGTKKDCLKHGDENVETAIIPFVRGT